MFFDLSDYEHPRKRLKLDNDPNDSGTMTFRSNVAPTFLTAPLQSLSSHSRHGRHAAQRQDDSDAMLSSDLEVSFASNVSLNSPQVGSLDLTPESEFPKPMDISPMPLTNPNFMPRDISTKKTTSRPRAFTSGPRLFGNDVSNLAPPVPREASIKSGSHSSSKRTQRAALPTAWFGGARDSDESNSQDMLSVSNIVEPVSDDAMDVDSSFGVEASPTVHLVPPQSAAATITSFNSLFYDSNSPAPSERHQNKKRRSLSPETSRHSEQDPVSSSPGFPSSPSEEKLERIATAPLFGSFAAAKPSLDGLGLPPANFLKRPRRPALSAMVHPSESQTLQSAFPVPTRASVADHRMLPAMPPTRRAFSALIAPTATAANDSMSSDQSSFDIGDGSSPAQQYAKRQQIKTIRRCDGTDDFRPLTGATALALNESPSTRLSREGLPGFAVNESQGKILPCHRVKEDGLMRIVPSTLNDLMDGVYDKDVGSFHIIDCRFDYEYNGGHIPGAVNINTANQIEESLLGPSLLRPRPCLSGDGARKTILVFHCEFSAKRAPTLATHLRRKDRALNSGVYPKVHYPEVYILEGGYCQYFKEAAPRCEPSAYVRMDDPLHTASRREDLDQFRKTKFGRHRSYAYGDAMAKASLGSQAIQQPSKRNTLPSGGSSNLFAAAGNAARSRRGTVSLMPLAEDIPSPGGGDETESEIGDSPCPPPTKVAARKPIRLTRAETYGPSRFPLHIS